MATRYRTTCETCPFDRTYNSQAKADHAHRRHSCARHLRSAELAARAAAREAAIDRTPKPCLHRQADHQHGTYACYVQDQCRCLPCAASNANYEQNRTRQQAYGRWSGLVDSGPSRSHIQQLLAQGMGLKRIVAVSEVSSGVLWKLMYGKTRPDGSRTPAKRITPRNEQRILAIRVDLADGALVDATGAVRRIQALVALGWSQSKICVRLGVSRSNFTPIAQGVRPTMVVAHDKAIRALYDELSMRQPPETNQRERIAASRSRNYAKARGWLPPLAWDDEQIDDPAAQPLTRVDEEQYLDHAAIERRMAGEKAVALTRPEQAELVGRMVAQGVAKNEIERRTGVNPYRVSAAPEGISA